MPGKKEYSGFAPWEKRYVASMGYFVMIYMLDMCNKKCYYVCNKKCRGEKSDKRYL